MKNLLLILFVFIGLTTACTKEEKRYTPEEAKKLADSIYQQKAKVIIKDAEENLKYRQIIEIREKVDQLKNNSAISQSSKPRQHPANQLDSNLILQPGNDTF